ncbi:hypothetical protein MAPG_11857 [Magnaporthiopsis poae ATCC 64411]|uniref:Aldehyde dehydrogenase domain-containing protein n=1 Tax=Magnaporthiopsis poae (strain ATCC 64411 / 73-15) TaxID=644358 RepID=A0A0C4EGC3_MAGP6|nr:hypothetical protein MAPG_11857 [Magnaporthiopsis poae ATCC 64411]
MPKPFSKVRSAAIDGRALNPIFRKLQLRRLHDLLSDKAAEIQDALTGDVGDSPVRAAEAQLEYWLAMRVLSQEWAALDTGKALHDEYAVSRGQNSLGREPVGIVVIHPARHAFLFALMSALAPALAAGNCVIVHTEQTLQRTPRLVLDLVAQALDDEIFAVADSPPSDSEIGHPHVRVLQNGSADGSSNIVPSHHLVSDSDVRVAAVVERDADLDLAARELVRARFGFRGSPPPYAPDVVLVNEWVKPKFMEAVVRHTVRFSSPETKGKRPSPVPGPGQSLSEKLKGEKGLNVVSWSSTGIVVDVEDRQSSILRSKVHENCLLVHATTSIDDAIDVANRNGRLGAAYIFAKLAPAKYICQFLGTPLSFVNHCPTSLLFWPMTPQTLAGDLSNFSPYGQDVFSLPKTQIVAPSAQETSLAKALQLDPPGCGLGAALALEAAAKLPALERPYPGIRGLHFFMQGILTGGILLLSPVLTAVGVGSYYGIALFKAGVFHNS